MTSKFFRAGLCALVLVVVLAPAVASGQDPLIPPAMYAVRGAPFTASIESVWEGTRTVGPGRKMTRILRDTDGRQRFETPAMEEAAVTGRPLRIDIYDVVREKIIYLDPQQKTAMVIPMGRMGRPVTIDLTVRSDVSRKASPGGEYLGMRSIAGLDAWGQRVMLTRHYDDGHSAVLEREMWLSTVYRMPLMDVREDPLRGKLTQQVIRFEAGEPDASLFEIPAGYTVLQR